MARTSARSVRPSLSDDPRDNTSCCAELVVEGAKKQHSVGARTYVLRRLPEMARGLSEDDEELVLTLADVMGSAHKDSAEGMAAWLPSAPTCPL
jgi:hypothetical protein